MLFHMCDFDLDPMTSTFKSDLDMVSYLHDKNEVSRSKSSKVLPWQTDTWTDAQMDGPTDRRTDRHV